MLKALTQSETAYQGLRREILECQLLPSAKIKMSYVCDTYGVSLGAAREALSRLAADGLTVMEAQKGFTVASVSWEEYAELTEIRAEIEVSCLRKAIRHGDLEWETGIVASLHRLARAHESGLGYGPRGPDPVWLQAHAAFHSALVAACPNRSLLALRQTLFARSERYRFWSQVLALKLGARDVKAEHAELARLTNERDEDAAAAAMARHFRTTSDDVLAAVAANGNAMPDWQAPG